MFSTINPTSLLFAFAYALTLISAAPTVPRAELVVFDPQILYPNAETVWSAGQSHNVTWDTSNAPKNISNKGVIVLKTASASSWTPVTLASGFSLLDGRHEIKVPSNVTTRHDWEVTLFGDSGNNSPPFTIQA